MLVMIRTAAALSSLSSTRAAPSQLIANVREIANSYDAFLLDQFGVLHDGVKPLPGAVECFDELARAGKKLIVLSNTSRRRAFAVQKLPKLGFDENSLVEGGFITSGEAAWERIKRDLSGSKMLWCSWSKEFQAWDPTYLDGLDVTLASAEEADFVLCQGSHDLDTGESRVPTGVMETGEPNAALSAALETCLARDLLMICANPDFTVTLPDGTRGFMPGKIAEAYEAMGGRVEYYGKPYAPAFEAAMALLGDDVDPSRVCHVGDSLLHDVAGANNAGIASLFIAGGIHADELGIEETGSFSDGSTSSAQTLSPDALERVFAERRARPTYTTPAFVWQ